MDNGSEFLNFEELEKLPNNNKCKLYYTMPYCSWQKGKDITPYSNFAISKIEYKINNMPRKRLKYLTAYEYSNLYVS